MNASLQMTMYEEDEDGVTVHLNCGQPSVCAKILIGAESASSASMMVHPYFLCVCSYPFCLLSPCASYTLPAPSLHPPCTPLTLLCPLHHLCSLLTLLAPFLPSLHPLHPTLHPCYPLCTASPSLCLSYPPCILSKTNTALA